MQDVYKRQIKNKYDAVLITIGAWSSIGLNCKGSDIPGVMGCLLYTSHLWSEITQILLKQHLLFL